MIYNQDRSRFLIVLRPSTDKELPEVWGLPAGNVKSGESPEEAVRRSLMEKLGVEGEAVRFIAEGRTEREDYNLFMKLYEAKITKGDPKVPQHVQGVTQYTQLRWGTLEDLGEADRKGSLCCRLYINSVVGTK